MIRWKFGGPKGDYTTVFTGKDNEREARKKAMIKRWGEHTDRVGTPSEMGWGLHVMEKTEVQNASQAQKPNRNTDKRRAVRR